MSLFREYQPHRGFNAAPEIDRLETENAALRARIAELENEWQVLNAGSWEQIATLMTNLETAERRIEELEKAREPIDTGWAIVSPLSDGRLMCHHVFDLADDAWDDWCCPAENRAKYEALGYRAVKVAVVRVESA